MARASPCACPSHRAILRAAFTLCGVTGAILLFAFLHTSPYLRVALSSSSSSQVLPDCPLPQAPPAPAVSAYTTPPPPPLAPQLPPHSGVRVLLVMADNRAPSASVQSDVSLAAYLNFQYTRLHAGMDFRFVQHLLNLSSNSPDRDRPACYNAALGQYRAASWCKLQAVYHLMRTETAYDWLLYLDSDAVVTNLFLPVDGYLALVDAHLERGGGVCGTVAFLNASSDCVALFASDDPWYRQLPNGGMWLVKRNALGMEFVSTWWHLDNSGWNTRWPHFEQHTLQHLMFGFPNEAKPSVTVGGRAMPRVMAVIDEPTMSDVTQTRLQYVRHRYNGQADGRGAYFERRRRLVESLSDYLAQRGVDTNYTAVMERVVLNHTLRLGMEQDRIPLPATWASTASSSSSGGGSGGGNGASTGTSLSSASSTDSSPTPTV